MQVEIEDTGPSRKTMRVTVPPESVKTHLDRLYRSANQQVRMKGFRPGKIPKKVLEERLGETILAEAKESIINETFQEAMRSEEMDVVGQPKLDVSEEPIQEGEALSYSVELELRPSVTVGDVKSIAVQRKPTEATDEDIDNALEELAQAKRKMQPVDDEIEASDFAKVDMSYKVDGAEVVKKEGLQINPGIPVRGCDPEEFREKLVGQKKDDVVAVPIKYPDTFEKEDVRGKEGDLEIKVLEVMRFVAPPIDDELAKVYEHDSLDELKVKLRENMSAEKKRAEENRIEEEVLDHLFAENPFDLPEGLIADEIKHRLDNGKEEMQRQGASEEEAQRQAEAAKGEVEEASRRGIRNLFLVEAIMKKEKLFVTESDVEAELKRIATENETTLVEVKKHVEDRKLAPEIRIELMNRKVREFLRKTASITEEAQES